MYKNKERWISIVSFLVYERSKKMKKIIICLLLIFLSGCVNDTKELNAADIDAISSVSLDYEYQKSTYSKDDLREKLKLNEYGNIIPSVSISTVNEDNTPNVGIFIPSMITINKKEYLIAWFSSGTNTFKNLSDGRSGTFLFHEYDNSLKTPRSATNEEKTEIKLARNKGCRVVVQYVGEAKQNELYKKANLPESLKKNKLILEIINIYPLG